MIICVNGARRRPHPGAVIRRATTWVGTSGSAGHPRHSAGGTRATTGNRATRAPSSARKMKWPAPHRESRTRSLPSGANFANRAVSQGRRCGARPMDHRCGDPHKRSQSGRPDTTALRTRHRRATQPTLRIAMGIRVTPRSQLDDDPAGQCRQDSGSSNQRSASKSADTRWAGSSQDASQSARPANRSRASSRYPGRTLSSARSW